MLLFSASLATTEAQTTTAKYHAVDGSTWMTNVDRDKKEDLIWNQINLDIKAAQNAGRLGSETFSMNVGCYFRLSDWKIWEKMDFVAWSSAIFYRKMA